MKDLHNNINVLRGISPTTATTDNTAWVSQIIDTANFEATEFLLLPGALADADATFTVLIEEGDNSGLSDAAAVADEDLLGTEAAASFIFSDDNTPKKIGYKGTKRYVRLTVTPANNTGNAFLAAIVIQAGARRNPQA